MFSEGLIHQLQERRYLLRQGGLNPVGNPARRYDIDRLVEELEDHNRRAKSARSRHLEPPVFTFKLEEQEGR